MDLACWRCYCGVATGEALRMFLQQEPYLGASFWDSIIPTAADLTTPGASISYPTAINPSGPAGSIVQFSPATSNSSWQSILDSVAKIVPTATNAYTAISTANAAQQAANAVPQQPIVLPAANVASATPSNMKYYLIGGVALLALVILTTPPGGSKARRR